MKDPYPLVRALEVILSLNGNVLDTKGLEKAKELALKGLSKYNAQTDSRMENVDSLIKELQRFKLEFS